MGVGRNELVDAIFFLGRHATLALATSVLAAVFTH